MTLYLRQSTIISRKPAMTEPLSHSILAVGMWALGVSALIYAEWWIPFIVEMLK